MIECEACHKFFEDSGIVWDLKEDRVVCIECLPDSEDFNNVNLSIDLEG